tara:strand:- start:113984 stop:114505 length:522 start_codon:yes stop_codon:yes gene_type:complete
MKKGIFILFMAITFVACKSDKKEVNETVEEDVEQVLPPAKLINSFEDKLLDFRDVKLKFNDSYTVEKFGMLKQNDTVFSFVFKLGDDTEKLEVEKYSIGVVGYDSKVSDPFRASFNPELEIKDNKKYLILTREIGETRYFDSIDVYTYKRKDWKASGRLGGFKVRDILFEDKK